MSIKILAIGFAIIYSGVVLAFDASSFKIPSEEDLKKKLTREQFEVTQNDATERAFNNAYWDNKEDGIYVDIVSGEPLFSSKEKYDSRTGWPSFWKPLEEDNLTTRVDGKLFWQKRTEVRSKHADSHLGHVFEDGPEPTGLRYCINSAALRFIPVAKLVSEGYGQYLSLFNEGSAAAAPVTNQSDKKQAVQSTYFAGGCFWCMEPPFEKMDGVISVVSGYIGGTKENPTYEEVTSGNTGHAEAVKVEFDSSRVSFERLLEEFWKNIDPTTENAQFCDQGTQYRSGIFYANEKQKLLAEASRDKIVKSGVLKAKVVTEITQATKFYPAEEYHQDYYKKNPARYNFYRYRCGRDQTLERIWGVKQ